MCVGIVPLDRIILGEQVAPGDAIVGVRSSGIHSNGFTLARKALFEAGGLKVDQRVPELGCSVGEELLRPTDIYVRPVMELLRRRHVAVRALVNITGDGFLNLTRIKAAVSFELDRLPEPPPIFGLIQTHGKVAHAEMYRVFNMGIGFCVVVADEGAALDAVREAFAAHGFETRRIGTVVPGEGRRVILPRQNLVGEGDAFRPGR
jgi:phosphoribosylformylglycinamidine cyclo-ligase